MADVETKDAPIQSAPWWLQRLHDRLEKRRPALDILNDYYVGDQPLAYSSDKFRQAFGGLFMNLSDNWCGVVVDAVEERVKPQGIRIVSESDAVPLGNNGDRTLPRGVEADKDAWVIWQRNNLDTGSQMAHVEALTEGYANLLVWSDQDGKALITPEAASQSLVECYPGSRQRAAAIKEWRDDWTGKICATVYLPDAIYKYMSRKEYKEGDGLSRVKWEQRFISMGPEEADVEEWPLPNPLGVVPMICLPNRPRLLDEYDSEIRGLMPLQDAVNKLVADMLVAAEFQAFRQRWATGLEIPVDPQTNQPVEPFKAAVDRLWLSENAEATFGEFAQADLRIFVAGIEMFVQHAATQSRTPPHYFYLSGQFPSGESIKSAETGLVSKALRRMTHWGEAHEEALRLAFAVEQDPRADAFMSEMIWGDPESRSEAEHTDAIIKMSKLNVPDVALWERWGATPQEIERWQELQEVQEARELVKAQELRLALPSATLVSPGGNGPRPPTEEE